MAIAELLIESESTDADGGLCEAYGTLAEITAEIGPAADIFLEASQALTIVTIEENNNVRFDDEARDVIRDWLESDCA